MSRARPGSQLDLETQETTAEALRRMSDDQLKDLYRKAYELVREHADMRLTGRMEGIGVILDDPHPHPVATWLAWTVLIPLENEIVDRRHAERDAEIALEANGHEVFVGHDAVQEERTDAGWFAVCHCETTLADERGRVHVETDMQARAIGEAHIAEHGGRWWEHSL